MRNYLQNDKSRCNWIKKNAYNFVINCFYRTLHQADLKNRQDLI